MDASETTFGDETGKLQDDLRQQIASTLVEQADMITADTVAIFPYSGSEELDTEYCHRIGQLLTQLLAFAVRDGRLDAARAASSATCTASSPSARCRSSGCSRSPT